MFVHQSNFVQIQQQTRLLQQDSGDHQGELLPDQVQNEENKPRKKTRKIVKKRRVILKPIEVTVPNQHKNQKKRKVHKKIKKCNTIIKY
ncbi:unnamed protein product (macronuclear) [Paramecium tetraurelia]|uniref:Uncharacterized protein n=1 Tax=Paramecium tetraurelia TaxID=5888 RepID=A0BGH8_PARTE|nr:uncharacterized protein GSPATT00028680001 [Paramecium tetraurelia]CAK57645.1 unnamed protein product [Paramecium tetraurelia]|eukprot:XP_001425043.1 hypothetical protein (macronuclear) [Paramecium tetraurelia strain d4-2]